MQPVAPQITHDTWPRIIDALLMLTFMIGEGGYCNLFRVWRQPKIPSWLTTTYRRCDFQGCMTKNHWSSVDAHFHAGAGRVLLSVLPTEAAKNSFVTAYNLSEVWFPTMHDQQSLTLCWHSFCHGCHLIWHSPSFILFWLPFWYIYLYSSWSLRCSLIIHRYI